MTQTTNRNSAIDPLRLALALCVIALHTGFPDGIGAVAQQVLVNGIYRLAVPVFALIAGFFFLGALRTGRARAYALRIVSVYALWMVIYLPVYGPDFTSVGHVLQTVLFGYFHLWFLPGLLIGALLVAALHRAGAVPLALVAASCALTGLILQWLVLSGRVTMPLDYYRNGLFVIFPFFTTGYLLALAESLPRIRWQWPALALILVAVESMVWFRIAGGGFGVDTLFSLYLAAPLLFLGARQASGGWDGKRIASMAAFVYFSHILIMISASRFGLSGNIKTLVVAAVALGVAWWLGAERRRPVLALLT